MNTINNIALKNFYLKDKLADNTGVNEFGFSSYGLTQSDFTKEGNIIQLGYPPLRIDLLTQIDGVIFKECYENKMVVQIEELVVDFIGYTDLIKNKKKSGRLRDLDDLDNLK